MFLIRLFLLYCLVYKQCISLLPEFYCQNFIPIVFIPFLAFVFPAVKYGRTVPCFIENKLYILTIQSLYPFFRQFTGSIPLG